MDSDDDDLCELCLGLARHTITDNNGNRYQVCWSCRKTILQIHYNGGINV